MKLDIQLFADDGTITLAAKLNTKDFENGLNKIESSTQKAGTSVKNIVASLGIAKIISKGINLITSSLDDATKRFDTLNNFPKVMNNLGISAKDADKQINRMSEALAGLPTTLDQGAMAVQRFTSKNSDVKKSTDIFLALNNAILAGGAGTEIQASALEQLSQSYAKGKMDMMEWRTVQMAMPAQLKQVATAMGMTTEQLGIMLREGDNTAETMDEFMNTIIKLNKEGSNGFLSFEKQARNSTNGIRTAITVAKTQVVKGVTDMITGINKGLKKSNLGSLSDIISKLGKEAKIELDKVATAFSKIPFDKVLSATKTLIPIIASLTAGIIAYNTAMKVRSMVTFVADLGKATASVLGLIPALTSATASQQALNLAQSISPIGLLISGVAALTAGLVYLSTRTSEVDREINKSNETLKEYNDSMKQIQKQKDEMLSQSMNEIYYNKSLSDELKNITDENGRIKEGYEDRANFIANELSQSLGIEIKLTDGIIENYQDIQGEIQSTIEKKKAMAYFNAHEQEYTEALKKESTLLKEVSNYTTKKDDTLKKINKTMADAIAHDQDLVNYEEELMQYYKGEIEYADLTVQARGKVDNMRAEESVALESLREKYIQYDETLQNSAKTYADNEIIIIKWRKSQEELAKAEQALAEGKKEEAQKHFDAVQKIFNDTTSFNAKTMEENNKKYEEEKKRYDAYLDYLKKNQNKYGEEFYEKEKERIDKEMEQRKNEKEEANKIIEEKNKKILDTTIAGLNDQLKAMGIKNVEFKNAGKGNVDVYVEGMKDKKTVALDEATTIVSEVNGRFNEGKIGSKQAGKDITEGLAGGMDEKKQYAKDVAARLATEVLGVMRVTLDEHSPSKKTRKFGDFFVQGFTQGIEESKNESIKSVKKYGEDVLNELSSNDFNSALNDIYSSMKSAVDLETGKITANVELGNASKNLSQMINASASFDGTIELQANIDGEKVWENQQKITQRKSLQYGGVR